MGEHQDKSEGKEMLDEGRPVVSVSLGDSMEFTYRNSKDEAKKRIVLKSGDVLIFGGPSRMIWHSVDKCLPNTAPKDFVMDPKTGRINLTLRSVRSVRSEA